MKKVIVTLMAVLLCASLIGCGDPTPPTPEKVNVAVAEKELREYTEYNRETYLKPLWHTREIYNETVLFVGENDKAPLLYTPSEVISVRNYKLDVEYVQGVDYVIEDGKISRTPNSSIPYMKINDYYLKAQPSGAVLEVDKSAVSEDMLPLINGPRWLKYGETTTFTQYQIAVTYRHNQPWTGSTVIGHPEKFQSFINKLQSGENAKILFFGDSITVGCNASGTPQGGNISPYCESWTNMVTSYLNDKYDVTLEYVNTAIGGTATKSGRDRFQTDVLDHEPDLLVIAYGMNDRETSPQNYKSYIEQMVSSYHMAIPDGNILLVSTQLPNPECLNWNKNQKLWEPILQEVASNNDFCAVAPVTSMHASMQNAGKRYRDYTANNVNHPNDFIVRLYAQVCLKTMLGNSFFTETFEQI